MPEEKGSTATRILSSGGEHAGTSRPAIPQSSRWWPLQAEGIGRLCTCTSPSSYSTPTSTLANSRWGGTQCFCLTGRTDYCSWAVEWHWYGDQGVGAWRDISSTWGAQPHVCQRSSMQPPRFMCYRSFTMWLSSRWLHVSWKRGCPPTSTPWSVFTKESVCNYQCNASVTKWWQCIENPRWWSGLSCVVGPGSRRYWIGDGRHLAGILSGTSPPFRPWTCFSSFCHGANIWYGRTGSAPTCHPVPLCLVPPQFYCHYFSLVIRLGPRSDYQPPSDRFWLGAGIWLRQTAWWSRS